MTAERARLREKIANVPGTTTLMMVRKDEIARLLDALDAAERELAETRLVLLATLGQAGEERPPDNLHMADVARRVDNAYAAESHALTRADALAAAVEADPSCDSQRVDDALDAYRAARPNAP